MAATNLLLLLRDGQGRRDVASMLSRLVTASITFLLQLCVSGASGHHTHRQLAERCTCNVGPPTCKAKGKADALDSDHQACPATHRAKPAAHDARVSQGEQLPASCVSCASAMSGGGRGDAPPCQMVHNRLHADVRLAGRRTIDTSIKTTSVQRMCLHVFHGRMHVLAHLSSPAAVAVHKCQSSCSQYGTCHCMCLPSWLDDDRSPAVKCPDDCTGAGTCLRGRSPCIEACGSVDCSQMMACSHGCSGQGVWHIEVSCVASRTAPCRVWRPAQPRADTHMHMHA